MNLKMVIDVLVVMLTFHIYLKNINVKIVIEMLDISKRDVADVGLI
ncbi:MAG: hypothetical protein AABW57_01790 [Nanoarchaeota archaeon]